MSFPNRPGKANITTLAERANMSRDRAKRLLDEHGVTRDKYRQYPEDDALEILNAATDQSCTVGNRLAGRGSDAGNINLNAVAAARADAEQARAEKIRLDLDIRKGNLIDKRAVAEAAVDFATHMRNGLLSLGAKAADRCVGKNADEIAAIITAEVRDVLADLSNVDTYIVREIIG